MPGRSQSGERVELDITLGKTGFLNFEIVVPDGFGQIFARLKE